MPKTSHDQSQQIVHLVITLKDVVPKVSRVVAVPLGIHLDMLHLVLQATMGWTDSHLHEYVIARKHYSIPDPDWPSEEPLHDERRVQLKPFIEARVRRFTYLYDGSSRVRATLDALNRRTTLLWDGSGNRKAVIDPTGKRTSFLYSGAGQMTGVISALGQRTTNLYLCSGQPQFARILAGEGSWVAPALRPWPAVAA